MGKPKISMEPSRKESLGMWGWSLAGAILLGGFLYWYMNILRHCFPTSGF